MIRTLLIVTGFGTAIALVCLTAAASIAGSDISKNGFSWTVAENDGHVSLRKNAEIKPEPSATRTLDWNGTDALIISAPVDVTFTQGATASVIVTGPKSMTERLSLDNGRLSMAEGPGVTKVVSLKLGKEGLDVTSDNQGFKVTITAPAVKRFEVAGAGDLTVVGYDQPSLDLRISGAGHAEVTGKTETLALDISGMGDADLGALITTDADISISGAGDADIAPTGKAAITVSGTGNVALLTKPSSLTTNISGAGSVEQE